MPDRPDNSSSDNSSPEVLALLACPACLGALQADKGAIACRGCGRLYPMRDAIPVLIVDQAVSSNGTATRET